MHDVSHYSCPVIFFRSLILCYEIDKYCRNDFVFYQNIEKNELRYNHYYDSREPSYETYLIFQV